VAGDILVHKQNNDKKDRQAIVQAFQKYTKSNPNALTLYAQTATQKDTDADLRNKLRRIDTCMKQHPTDATQEYEAIATLLDPSILAQGLDASEYKTLRAAEVTARSAASDLQCTVPVAVLLQYFKSHGYQHICTGTLIGYEIFQEVHARLGEGTRLAAILTEVGAKYGLFYSRKSIVLYFLSALYTRHPSKLTRIIQTCPTFAGVQRDDFLETRVYERTVALKQPDELFRELLVACSDLDMVTESLTGSASLGVGSAYAAHTTRAAGVKRNREEPVPCWRYFSYMTCHYEATKGEGACPHSHDSLDDRLRGMFLRELEGSKKHMYAMFKKGLEQEDWNANAVLDEEFRQAIIGFIEKMKRKESEAVAPPKPPARRRGGRGAPRGYRGPSRRGTPRGYRGRGGSRGWGFRTPARPPRGWSSSSSSSSSPNQPPQAYTAEGGEQQGNTNSGDRIIVIE